MRNIILWLLIFFSCSCSSEGWNLSDELRVMENEISENYLFKFAKSNVNFGEKSTQYNELLDYLNLNRFSDFILFYELGYKNANDSYENNFLLCVRGEKFQKTFFQEKIGNDSNGTKLETICSKLANSSMENGIRTLHSDESITVYYGDLPVYGLLKVENGHIIYRQLKILRFSSDKSIADRVISSFTGPVVDNVEQQFFIPR